MRSKKVLKILGVIILILIALLLIHTVRNYIIIADLQNKIAHYMNSSNYYTKSIATEENGTIVTMEYYRKDNKQVVFLERNVNGEISKISMYDNGERINTYTETKDTKIAQLNSGTIMSINIYNYLETESNLQTFLGSIFTRIKSTKYNGKECYAVKGFLFSSLLVGENQETYIEKNTGLFVKATTNGILTEREYEFDNVDDSIFIEPDISQYIISNNS